MTKRATWPWPLLLTGDVITEAKRRMAEPPSPHLAAQMLYHRLREAGNTVCVRDGELVISPGHLPGHLPELVQHFGRKLIAYLEGQEGEGER